MSLPGLTRQSIRLLKIFVKIDGYAGTQTSLRSLRSADCYARV
jgi:hypothetical protein